MKFQVWTPKSKWLAQPCSSTVNHAVVSPVRIHSHAQYTGAPAAATIEALITEGHRTGDGSPRRRAWRAARHAPRGTTTARTSAVGRVSPAAKAHPAASHHRPRRAKSTEAPASAR